MYRAILLLVGLATPLVAGGVSKIAFVSIREGNPEIYLMNPDGSGKAKLISFPGHRVSPAWSPDGRHIAFVSYPRFSPGESDILVVRPDGTGLVNVTGDAGGYSDPTWSPDGSQIAFTDGVGDNREIFVVGADGSDRRMLTTDLLVAENDKSYRRDLSWSPDGTSLLFSYTTQHIAEESGGMDIMRLDFLTLALTNLTMGLGYNASPCWSPDGSRIAFYSTRDDEEGVYLMNTDGTGVVSVSPGWAWDWDPTWSPDGRQIAFGSSRGLRRDIHGMPAEGGEAINLTDNPDASDEQPAWSPWLPAGTAVEPASWGHVKARGR